MKNSYKSAGAYELKRFDVIDIENENRSYDLKNITYSFNIYESILNASVRGTATVYDAVGVYYNAPLRGQEKIIIEYIDSLGVTHEDIFFLYSITDVRPSKYNSNDILEYKIHFVSMGKFWSERHSVSRCVAENTGKLRTYLPISDQVGVIFNDYYSEGTQKSINISNTDGPQKIVIPNLSPEESIHLLSRKAYSSSTNGQLFRFFENRKEYRFSNLEELFSEKRNDSKEYYYNTSIIDNSPDQELDKLNRIITLDLGESVNTIEVMKSGGYNRKYIELDVLSRVTNTYDHDQTVSHDDFEYPDGKGDKINLTHSKSFISTHLNNEQTVYGIKDYSDRDKKMSYGIRPHVYYGDIYNNKSALSYHYRQSKIKASVYGSNELFAGEMIKINYMPMFGLNQGETRDEERIGYYLVESVDNVFFENQYTQNLTLVKGGFLK